MALQDYSGRTIQAADLNANFDDERTAIDTIRSQTRKGLNVGFSVIGLDDGTAVPLEARVFDFRPPDDFEVDGVRIYIPTSAAPLATLTLTCPAGEHYLQDKTWSWTSTTSTKNFVISYTSTIGFNQLWLKKGVPYRMTLVSDSATPFLMVSATLAGRIRRRRA